MTGHSGQTFPPARDEQAPAYLPSIDRQPLPAGIIRTDLALRRGKAYPANNDRVRARRFAATARKDLNMTSPSWQPATQTSWPHPPMLTAIGRGLLGRCPGCGQSHLFNGFLRVVAECRNCGAPLGLARADDAPPYLTILVTGHIVVPLIYMVDRMNEPPIWVMSAIFLPLTFCVALGLLRPIKGGTVGVMLNLNMLKSDASGT